MVIELTNGTITLDRLGNADTLDGLEEEKQIIRNALLIYFGTWFDDTNIGVDWLRILEKQFTVNEIKSEIRKTLISLAIITKIIALNLGSTNPNRDTVLTFVVNTVSGNTVEFSEVL